MKRVLFLLMAIVALASSSASAQIISGVKGSLASRNSQGGVIKITEDEGTKQAVHVVEKNTKRPEKADGYRFVIFYDNEQFADERARDALAKFRSNYKSVSSYLSSEAPSFRIVVGDCFTYEDVAILRNLIGDDYPDAALSDARIPYKVLCRIKGQNRMKIERSGVVTGGIYNIRLASGDFDGNGTLLETNPVYAKIIAINNATLPYTVTLDKTLNATEALVEQACRHICPWQGAYGNYSHAEGNRTKAIGRAQHV